MQPLGKKKNNATTWDQKNHATSSEKNHAISQNKTKNHATPLDKESFNL